MASSGRVAATLVMVVVGAVFASCGNAANNGVCPLVKELVYPVGSTCDQPARYYYGGDVFELGLISIIGSVVGGLAPEWDETNATFYVRSAQVGAKYAFTHLSREYRPAVSQSDNVLIFNIETGRSLGWRQEGENESFLVEGDDLSNNFQFVSTPYSSSVLCRFVDPAVTCEFYHLAQFGSGGSLGVSEYVENDVTYFQLSSLHPQGAVFGLFRSTSSKGVLRSVIA